MIPHFDERLRNCPRKKCSGASADNADRSLAICQLRARRDRSYSVFLSEVVPVISTVRAGSHEGLYPLILWLVGHRTSVIVGPSFLWRWAATPNVYCIGIQRPGPCGQRELFEGKKGWLKLPSGERTPGRHSSLFGFDRSTDVARAFLSWGFFFFFFFKLPSIQAEWSEQKKSLSGIVPLHSNKARSGV